MKSKSKMKKQNKSNLGETDMLLETRTVILRFPGKQMLRWNQSVQDAYCGVPLEGMKAKVDRGKSSCQERAHERLSLGLRGHNSLSELPQVGSRCPSIHTPYGTIFGYESSKKVE